MSTTCATIYSDLSKFETRKMLRCVFLLLLINASSRSMGNPIQQSANGNSIIADSLSLLADWCRNPLLVEQIRGKISECADIKPPLNGKQIECLMFFDINTQLCAAENASRMVIDKDFTSQINEVQDVTNLCNESKDWKALNLSIHVHYKATIEKVFKNPLKCAQICAVDILSEDANFYCKYYKWGSNLIKHHVSTPQVDVKQSAVSILSNMSVLESKPADAVTVKTSTYIASESISNPGAEEQKESISLKSTSVKAEVAASNDEIKTEGVKTDTQIKPKEEMPELDKEQKNEDNPQEPTEDKAKEAEPAPLQEIIGPNEVEMDKPVLAREEIPKKDDKQGDKTINQSEQQKIPIIENPKVKLQGADPDDYQGNDLDSEEGKDGLPDMGDDAEDPMLAEDIKTDQEQRNTGNEKKIEPSISIFNADLSQREIYTSSMQDGFPDDDDHFFPFFLTAVILVVLLYVLYHNKNKVSKVFFGLIVEGRQPGRRRNSRGHAYRRLDTLEQAMSTNAAAPPSKIIY